MDSRVYSLGDRVPLLPLERAGRPARAEELDPGRGALRRRRVERADRPPSAGACSSGSAPVVRAIAQDERSQLRNRELATDRILEQLREAVRVRAAPQTDRADARLARAAPRREETPGRDEAPAARARSLTRADQPLDRVRHLGRPAPRRPRARSGGRGPRARSSATPSSAARVAETCVRMSMQYRSSSIIFCRPRTWPSMRLRRLSSACLVVAANVAVRHVYASGFASNVCLQCAPQK